MMWLWRAVLLGLFVLLSGLCWQLYAQQQLSIQRLQQEQKSLTQQLGDLNDRLVALSRVQSQPVAFAVESVVTTPEQGELLRQNIRQGLKLAQAALQDGRQQDADAVLLGIQNTLNSPAQQWLAPALVDGLRTAIQSDRVQIGQTAQRRYTARQSMDRAVMQIQQYLDHMASRGPVLRVQQNPLSAEVIDSNNNSASWLDRLAEVVSLQRVIEDQQVTLSQRALLCREAALTLGLARHAIRQQQPDQVRALLQETALQLSRLPDAEAVQARQWVTQLAVLPLPSTMPLSALALLPEQEAP